MDNLSYIGLSQQMALHRLMDVTANNLANMDTPGFKSENMLFKEYVNKTTDSGEKMSQVQSYGTYRDLGQGTLAITHNDLDVAIQGDGFFAVKTPEGTRYTRAGSFSLNDKGEVVTKAGQQVLSDGGSPLAVQPGATHISVSSSGSVSTEKGSLGKLKIVNFGNSQDLIPIGDTLYDAGNMREVPVDKPNVQQGMLEKSNVQPLLEMNKMIEILRLYQNTQNMLMNNHDMARSMIQRLTKS